MDKNLIIKEMVLIAEKNNIEAMQSAGMDFTAITNMAEQVRPQLVKIQGEILDTLVEKNFISIVE